MRKYKNKIRNLWAEAQRKRTQRKIEPFGFGSSIEITKPDDFKNVLITNKEHNRNEKALYDALSYVKQHDNIDLVFESSCPDDGELRTVEVHIKEALAKSRILGKGEKPKGSGMFPYPLDNPEWSIGCFGSIWCDAKTPSGNYRISFYPMDGFKFFIKNLDNPVNFLKDKKTIIVTSDDIIKHLERRLND